jgi:hypothetical protein
MNTWNDLSTGADTFYGVLPAAYVVEFNSNPVPEPGSIVLVVFGTALIGSLRRPNWRATLRQR